MYTRSHTKKTRRRFSMWRFVAVVVLSLAGYLYAVATLAPETWRLQLAASFWMVAGVFLVMHFVYAFVEHPFHRFVLHIPLVPFLSYFYQQHTRHHGLTAVRVVGTGKDQHIENHYAIEKQNQEEASFFPWYTFSVFAGVFTLLFLPIGWLFPSVPIFLMGPIALAFSLFLYETIHKLVHMPREKWEPLLTHPLFGRFWRWFYGLHLHHHRDIRANESISGFFGFPVADWLLGTYVKPKSLYEDGSNVGERGSVAPPTPCFIIRSLDRFAERIIRERKAANALETQ